MPVQDIRTALNHRQTVLILEDHLTVLEIHVAVMKVADPKLHIVAMTDPRMAIEWICKKRVDLIIADYRMKEMNGIDFVKAAKATILGNSVPIIVITAVRDVKIHQQLLAAGVLRTFKKPVDIVELITMSRQLLEKNKEQYETGGFD